MAMNMDEMMRPKKVAIIGAGPSGLVTAKTLLHHYPKGRFEPVVFESKPTVGGLWAGSRSEFIASSMRTNLSRFTVSFSDFSWETNNTDKQDDDLDMFPLASQVNHYLVKYSEKYIPKDVLRLCCRVVRTQRNAHNENGKWTIEWVDQQGADSEPNAESFDYLVVASGYFNSPQIPPIPGLHEFPPERVIHSSSLKSAEELLRDTPRGKILVAGGSMSGAEVASSLALALSSNTQSPIAGREKPQWSVHHLSSRPFWAVPTYLPTPDQPGSFLPLDIVMYDLARRPPGEIQYSLGPITPQRAAFVHKYFETMIGSDQSDVGKALAFDKEEDRQRPPWVAVTDHYTEFVRSGGITTTLGRVESVSWSYDSIQGTVNVRKRNGENTSIKGVAAIVLATGFTPFNSLSFLPHDVLAALEYHEADTVFPILLDGKGSFNPNVPDLGFVGMYRGPYWGVMEMQARSLAQKWDGDDRNVDIKITEITELRDFRSSLPTNRAQFPMGDYVGLMETFARELQIPRISLITETVTKEERPDERTGPVVPVRYSMSTEANKSDIASTLSNLKKLLLPSSEGRQHALSRAIFRALHGKWRMTRVSGTQKDEGVIEFRPRIRSDQASAIEYVYYDSQNPDLTQVLKIHENHITVFYPEATTRPLFRKIEFVRVDNDGDADNAYRHSATSQIIREGSVIRYEYIFHLKGVQLTSWEETTISGDERNTKTVYTR